MRTSIALLAAALSLTACATPEQAAYKEDPIASMAPQYGPSCEKHGYEKGSAPWRNCIATLSTRDDLERYSLFYDRYMQWYPIR